MKEDVACYGAKRKERKGMKKPCHEERRQQKGKKNMLLSIADTRRKREEEAIQRV